MNAIDTDMIAAPVTLDEAMHFAWLEADLLDSAAYDEWQALWTPTARYVVPIAPGVTDFENTLNYAYDDAEMRAKRAERLVSGQSVSASPVARTCGSCRGSGCCAPTGRAATCAAPRC